MNQPCGSTKVSTLHLKILKIEQFRILKFGLETIIRFIKKTIKPMYLKVVDLEGQYIVQNSTADKKYKR